VDVKSSAICVPLVAVIATALPAVSAGPPGEPVLEGVQTHGRRPSSAGGGGTSLPAAPAAPPNIVLITTDDQTDYDLQWMPATRALVGDAGARFTDSISPHPLCCPARAMILTGQFAHNNGVRTNVGDFGGLQSMRHLEDTIGPWLRRAGYVTGFTGKFLNGYRRSTPRPPGWDEFHPFVDRLGLYSHYDYGVSHNGDIRWHTDLYQADFLAEQSAEIISAAAAAGKPFFLWQSHVAPHRARVDGGWLDPIPAIRHEDEFPDAEPPSFDDPSFQEADISDKPSYLQESQHLSRAAIRTQFRQRIRTLQAVDEAVAKTIAVLRETGQLDRTYVFFTSDNGYLLGEHTYTGKVLAFEPSLQVPLLVRGPGVQPGSVRKQTVATVDLAPTFVDIADASPTAPIDGHSLLPLIGGSTVRGWETILVQGGPRAGTPAEPEPDPSGWFYPGGAYAAVHLRRLPPLSRRALRQTAGPPPARQRGTRSCLSSGTA
jgi:arylsulfatase A-like enzyme